MLTHRFERERPHRSNEGEQEGQALTPFAFDGLTIRAVMIDGEPWFVGKDVALPLGYSNPQKAVRDHCKAPRPAGVNESFTPPLDPQTTIINEADLLRLIVSSSLPAAERFERWVFEDVLPAIRRTGAYGAAPALPNLRDPKQMAAVAVQLLEVNQELQAQLTAAAPKIAFAEAVGAAENLQKVGDVAKALDIGPNKLWAWLRNQRIMMADNLPYQHHIDRGRFRVVERSVKQPDGTFRAFPQAMVTGKGITYIQQLLARQAAPEKALA